MNCEQAKEIRIVDYLSRQGIDPSRVYGDNVWYRSPLRDEKNPSFKVNIKKNSWYDTGTGSGGGVIDLVMQMNSTDVTGALLILQRPGLAKPSFSFSEKQSSPGIEIKRVQSLQNKALVQYVESRGIPAEIAAMYVSEAYYRVGKKNYFALAFKNDKGGYELRSKFFKGCASPKHVTTIPGNDTSLNVFEGFMDFLSAMVHFKTRKPTNKTIILNSLSNLAYIEPKLKTARKINLYLDNDEAGAKAAERVKEMNPNVTNHTTIIYPNNKDFNEFLNVDNHGK